MRGEASRLADRKSRDSFAAQFSGIGEDTWRIGNELFSITALLDGNAAASEADVRRAALPVLRHRIIANYNATGEGVGVEAIVQHLLAE